jgi:hypothetical protein
MRRWACRLEGTALAVLLAMAPLASVLAVEAPAEQTGLVGTIIAVVPESRTVVVDVPLDRGVLRVGAELTGKTRIVAGGAPASFEALKAGARVRLAIRRIPTGTEATLVEVLREPAR